MKIKLVLILIVFFSLIATATVSAETTNEQFEKSFYASGYREVYQALNESQKHYKKAIRLPIQVPSLPYSHIFGRFNDLDGEENDGLEVEYINKDAPQNHYMIGIRHIKYKLTVPERYISKVVKLKDGSIALISNQKLARRFYVLVFEHDGWQYTLSLDSDNHEYLNSKTLVDAANSLKLGAFLN